ncbi:UNVERIFIED_CONTAM: hypothetical protein HHA_462830 [Hammondia hammondi]|eukprot:XP_008888883.1 hypothetical protein HHA_462830 [Hammondia hammondi]
MKRASLYKHIEKETMEKCWGAMQTASKRKAKTGERNAQGDRLKTGKISLRGLLDYMTTERGRGGINPTNGECGQGCMFRGVVRRKRIATISC